VQPHGLLCYTLDTIQLHGTRPFVQGVKLAASDALAVLNRWSYRNVVRYSTNKHKNVHRRNEAVAPHGVLMYANIKRS
jgi:hypothetical protein